MFIAMKKIRFGLLSRVVLAIVLGVALGSFVPAPFVRGVNTVSAIIGQFIWQKGTLVTQYQRHTSVA